MTRAVKPTYHQTSLEDARALGRVDEEGHVYRLGTTANTEEVFIGQYAAGDTDQALQYYTRKFDELYHRVLLLGARVATEADSVSGLRSSWKALSQEFAASRWLGDVVDLERILAEIDSEIQRANDVESQQQQKLIDEKAAARETLVVEAEQIAAQDPQQVHFKKAQARMTELFEAWQSDQRSVPKLPKSLEDPLWKRFRQARSQFDRQRKAFFMERDKEASQVKAEKERLIQEAERLQTSTDFGPTTKAYHRLMDEWKAAGRGQRKTEDAQWARFRKAQDVFFSARDAANAETEVEYQQNLQQKEAILEQLRQLMPFTKPQAVKDRYQSLMSQWDDVGKIPRNDIKRMEAQITEIQDAFRAAQGTTLTTKDSAVSDRQDSMLSQLQQVIMELEAERDAAQQSGNTKKVAELDESLQARRSWLNAVRSR